MTTMTVTKVTTTRAKVIAIKRKIQAAKAVTRVRKVEIAVIAEREVMRRAEVKRAARPAEREVMEAKVEVAVRARKAKVVVIAAAIERDENGEGSCSVTNETNPLYAVCTILSKRESR